jgi:NAD(P)-dependent dehydrogenase (short-subunit alcohol dehydrogenase family)
MIENKSPVVLVTGASRGLGRGIARHLAAKGISVAINYANNRDGALETVRLCEGAGIGKAQSFFPVQADISRREERERLLQATLEKMGRIDALVNNAGIAPRIRADIIEADEESFQEVMATNLQGPYFLTQGVARYWQKTELEPLLANGFKIVFVTSISAEFASLNRGEYSISKAGLAMAAQLWALRLAGLGIQVFELRPGIMKTDMTRDVRKRYDTLIADGLVPEKRWGTEDDLGQAVTTIILGNLPFATGSVIHIDGGLHLRKL